jgi:large subunit ribosomal protein L1
MGSKKRDNNMSVTEDTVKIVEAPVDESFAGETIADAAPDATAEATAAEKAIEAKAAKRGRTRSAKYRAMRSQVDKTKLYDPFAAIELLKRLSYSKFDGTVEAHAVVREEGISAPVSFPHSTGRAIRVAVASDELLAKIGEGVIDFDVLVSTAEFMPKLTRHAKVLGPKGLMPNPKNGTLTTNPEKKKKELEAGTVTIKTEKKAPLIHVSLGKTSLETKALVENLESLLKAFKGKVLKLTMCTSMSPSLKVMVE